LPILAGFVALVAFRSVDDEPGQRRVDSACGGGPAIEEFDAPSSPSDVELPGFDLAYVPQGYQFDSVEDQTQLNGSLRIFVFRSGTGDDTFTLTRQVARAIDLSDLAAAMGVSCRGSGDGEPASLELANAGTRYLYWRAEDRVLALSSASVGRDELRRVAGGLTYDRAEDEAQPLLLPTTTTTSR
jgi:hypothetical protein